MNTTSDRTLFSTEGIRVVAGESLLDSTTSANPEIVVESVVLVKRAGNRLFHMHFNDNHMTTDDDMIVGTVHSITYLETLYWLDRCGYQ